MANNIIILIILGFIVFLPSFLNLFNPSERFTNDKYTLFLELANTDSKRQFGLMYRNYLPIMNGMLFVYDKKGKYKMWMKNTKIPLDLIYLDDDASILGVVKNMKPYSLQPYGIDIESKYLVEINAGLFDKLNLKKGNKLNYKII